MINKRLVLVCLLFLCIVFGLFAAESDMYVHTARIVKVYNHNLGFRVVYAKESLDLGVLYVPLDWFRGTEAKAQVAYGNSPSIPYMSVFWENGEFHHVQLYLHESKNHSSWDELESTPEIIERFDVESFEADF